MLIFVSEPSRFCIFNKIVTKLKYKVDKKKRLRKSKFCRSKIGLVFWIIVAMAIKHQKYVMNNARTVKSACKGTRCYSTNLSSTTKNFFQLIQVLQDQLKFHNLHTFYTNGRAQAEQQLILPHARLCSQALNTRGCISVERFSTSLLV